jgi:AraC family L-rhamnose operon regulatory protein RhaS
VAKPIPIYRDHDETYRADSCGSLARAAAVRSLQLNALCHGHYPGKRLPASALPGLKMVGYWDARADQNWGLGWHFNEGIEVTFLESGRLEFAVDGRVSQLGPDDVTVARPWQQHRVGSPLVSVSRLHWLILDVGVRRPNQEWKWPAWLLLSDGDREELATMLRHNEASVFRGISGARDCFAAIAAAVDADRDGSHLSHVAVRVNDLFLCLLEGLRRKKVKLDVSLSSTRRTVDLFLRDLKAHPEHLAIDWSVQEMAANCGLRTTQFVHHVRCLTNLAPLQYLNACRLEEAARLLAEEQELNVTEVALRCGFVSSQYFATVFAKRFGATPTSYRERAAAAALPSGCAMMRS